MQQTSRVRWHAKHGTHGGFGMGRHLPFVEALLLRLGVILGVQRQTTVDTTAGAPQFSPRWDKDQGVR